MKKFKLLLPLLFTFLFNHAQIPTYAWATQISGTASVEVNSMVLDATGNVYTLGSFSATTDFDPGPGVFNLSPVQAGYKDIYISKCSPTGNLIWAKKVGGFYDDNPTDIAIDNMGNLAITGNFFGTSNFNTGTTTSNLSASGVDAFILCLNNNGDYIWAKKIGSTNDDFGTAIKFDNLGNVYLTGNFKGTVDFDPGVAVNNLVSNGTGFYDIFILKLDPLGNYIWAKNFGGPSDDFGNAITVDEFFNVITTGSFRGTCDFDPGIGVYTLYSEGIGNPYISKLDANGNFVWAKTIRAFDSGAGNTVSTDLAGNVYSCGTFLGTADFDPGTPTLYLTSAGSADFYMSKLDINGNFIFGKRIGSTAFDNPNSLRIDATGNMFVTGNFSGTVDFNPDAGVNNLVSFGSADLFIAKFNSLGEYDWALNIGSTSADVGRRLDLDNLGGIVSVGRFSGTVDFNPGPAVNTLSTISTAFGAYTLKLAQNIVAPPTDINLDLTCFIQGYYLGSGMMNAVMSNEGIATAAANQTDIVNVELHDATSPYALAHSFSDTINDDGHMTCKFPISAQGNSYYIVLKHRNSIETWSANPVAFTTLNTTYDFSTAATQAYSSNQIDAAFENVWCIYNGDANQDGFVDIFDYLPWSADNDLFASGYLETDFNGDGIVDIFDYLVWGGNNDNFIGYVTP